MQSLPCADHPDGSQLNVASSFLKKIQSNGQKKRKLRFYGRNRGTDLFCETLTLNTALFLDSEKFPEVACDFEVL